MRSFGIPTRVSWRIALLAIAIIALGGYFLFGRGTNLGATLVVVSGDFREQVNVSGSVVAARDVDLGFAANGRVSGVYASVGERVEAGAVLAEIENADLVAALEQKRSILAQAQANLASLKAGTRPEELAVASAAVTNAEAALADSIQSAYTTCDDAVRNRADSFFTNPRTNPQLSFNVANSVLKMTVENDRVAVESALRAWAEQIRKLPASGSDHGDNVSDLAVTSQAYLAQVVAFLAVANGALSQGVPDQTTSAAMLASYESSLATARANVNAAAASLTATVSALDAAKKNLALKRSGATRDALDAQEAAVAAAAAEVRNAAAALAKTRVVAPFGGTVTRVDAKVGGIVSPSVSAISLQSGGVFQIETHVPEVAISGVAEGNPATTTLDAYGPSVFFAAKVVAIDPAETVKDGVPTYKTTLAFLAADSRIRSGMTADIVIETGVLRGAVVIPAGAVGKKDGMPYVSVAEGKRVVNRPVTVGRSSALGQVEIVSGLADGDVILLRPSP